MVSPLIVPGSELTASGSRFQGISEASGGNGVQNSSSNYPLVQLLSLVNEQTLFLPVDAMTGWSDTSFTSTPITLMTTSSSGFPIGYALVTVFTNGIPSQSQFVLAATSTPNPTPTPTITPTPTATPTATATPTPTPTSTPTPTPTPTSTPTVQVTVQTSPAGLAFSVDGTTYSSRRRFAWPSGSNHTIATTTPQSGGTGVQYVWTNWSDHGAISHTVAPNTNTTYTATFRRQYFLTMSHNTGGRVSPNSGWKNSGIVVSISATPGERSQFQQLDW